MFSDVDEELVVGLAGAAGVAIENARLLARVHELALVEDRERIARDLHDTVIQRLFATGMSLQSTVRLVSPDRTAADRIEQAVDDLDLTIKEIRTAIFGLERAHTSADGLRRRILGLVHESVGALGFEPRVRFDGPVDTAVSERMAEELVATLRESLSNVARHAHASRVDVEVVAGAEVSLRVADDGVGPPSENSPMGHGIGNMAARANNSVAPSSCYPVNRPARRSSGGCRRSDVADGVAPGRTGALPRQTIRGPSLELRHETTLLCTRTAEPGVLLIHPIRSGGAEY